MVQGHSHPPFSTLCLTETNLGIRVKAALNSNPLATESPSGSSWHVRDGERGRGCSPSQPCKPPALQLWDHGVDTQPSYPVPKAKKTSHQGPVPTSSLFQPTWANGPKHLLMAKAKGHRDHVRMTLVDKRVNEDGETGHQWTLKIPTILQSELWSFGDRKQDMKTQV